MGGRSATEERPTVALLLAVAAIVASLAGLQTTRLSGQASTERQRATVDEVANSFGVAEAIRFVFDAQVPVAVATREAELLAASLRAEAAGLSGADRSALEAEADAQEELAGLLATTGEAQLAADEYRIGDDGFDVGGRLGDELEDVSIRDPEIANRRARERDREALAEASALVPAAIALGCGSLAQVARRRRRALVTAGWVAVGVAVVVAVGAGAIA